MTKEVLYLNFDLELKVIKNVPNAYSLESIWTSETKIQN